MKSFYHATYGALLPKIRKEGLDTSDAQAWWEDSEPGVVYLALDPDVAASYAESSEMVPESWLDDIWIIEIPQDALDPEKLHADRNVIGGTDTFEYHGTIPIDPSWKIVRER
jgi:hypothetical protein